MPLKQVQKPTFKEHFEDCIAIVEADYKTIYFRYFISKTFGMGIAVTYRYDNIDPIREYYEIDISEEIMQNLTSAYLFIQAHDEKTKFITSQMVHIFNEELSKEFKVQELEINPEKLKGN